MKEVSGFTGNIVFDPSRPEGARQKLLNNKTMIQLGWKPQVDIQKGIEQTFTWYAKERELKK
jgi:GDP-L-fucose synthase